MVWMKWDRMGLSKQSGGLGFRDLESFNLALLAKQGWRLLHHPNSLLARVMKAKYYPHQGFLEARLGGRPSFAWRSILNSRELLQEGLIWQVGNGESIHIWHDPWVSNQISRKIQTPPQILPSEALVSSLIDSTTHWWNIPLIQEVFWPEEASRICSMAISPLGQSDRLVWQGTSNGVFSVRSAYHLAKTRFMQNQGETSAVSQTRRIWNSIWQLQVPGPVKMFLWRVCTNSLPTCVNLHRRKIVPDPLCPLCGLFPETTGHALWSCTAATDVWMECPRKIQKLALLEDDGFLLFAALRDQLEDEELELVVTIARSLWLRRNKVVFGGNFISPVQLFQQSQDGLQAFRQATHSSDSGEHPLGVTVRIPWQKPAVGVFKANWDAALDLTSKRMGVGVIVRDSTGTVQAALCSIVPYITDPTVAEGVALWRAVLLCSDMAIPRVHLEGDSQIIVNALLREGPCWSRYGYLLEAARHRLHGFQEWCVTHTRRDANEAAHRLAKRALTHSLNFVWQGSYPDFIQSIVMIEQGSSS